VGVEIVRIAVVGSGIGGMGTAWLLSREHEVDVFEADDRCGGHACTYDAKVGEGTYPVDVGFMVFNDHTYPNLIGLFGQLGIESRETEMSFSIHVDDTGMEWAGTNDVTSVFAQPANALNPKFLGMIKDIVRIGHDAQRLLDDESLADCTLGQLLEREGYGEGFREWYLVPMASAIWSAPPGSMLEFPAHTFLRFSHNHGLLYVTGRPKWRTVLGGSRTYVHKIEAKVANVYKGHVVRRITREDGRVRVGRPLPSSCSLTRPRSNGSCSQRSATSRTRRSCTRTCASCRRPRGPAPRGTTGRRRAASTKSVSR
jgi:predicted NAD/FAD-binding protein